MRIFPEMWASTLWPFSSSTRNIAFGSDSTIVPSSTMASSLGLGSGLSSRRRGSAPERPTGRRGGHGRVGLVTDRLSMLPAAPANATRRQPAGGTSATALDHIRQAAEDLVGVAD